MTDLRLCFFKIITKYLRIVQTNSTARINQTFFGVKEKSHLKMVSIINTEISGPHCVVVMSKVH